MIVQDISQIVVDCEKSFGSDFLLIRKPFPNYRYNENNERTQQINGYNYDLLCTKNYEKMTVKVLNEKQPSVIYNGKAMRVKIEDLSGRLWQNYTTGQINVSLSASKITAVKESSLNLAKGEKNE